MTDNKELEEKIAAFLADRNKETMAHIMVALEKATLFLPSMTPDNVDEKTMEEIKSGKTVKLPKETQIKPCLIKNDKEEYLLPLFSSPAQIPQEKKSPGLLAVPFFFAVNMVVKNKENLKGILLNPFTDGVVIPMVLLEMAHKRAQAIAAAASATTVSPDGKKTIKMNEQQFRSFAHARVSFAYLPKFCFENGKDALEKLQKNGAYMLLDYYKEVFPPNVAVPYEASDFGFMLLNVTDTLSIMRVDFPEKDMQIGNALRSYVAYNSANNQISYYSVEKSKDGLVFSQIADGGEHKILQSVPESGAELETIMEFVG